MKAGRSKESKAVKASGKSGLKTRSARVKNSSKKANKSDHKARGCSEELLSDKENQHFPVKESGGLCPELPTEDTFHVKLKEALEVDLHPRQTLTSSAKIKLQLFPANEEIRTGLEKDGHNPYLELTLSGRKKISSVLRHIEKKWGSSNTAKGEPMLFPYDRMENLSDCKRWTINDSDTTATSVYAAVGNPSIFRLKYGWFNIHEPTSLGISSMLVPCEFGVQSGGTDTGCIANLEALCDERDKIEATAEYKTTDVGNVTSEIVAQKMNKESTNPQDNEPKEGCSLQQTSMQWVDCLDNISIGGLLSEASLLGKFDSKLFGSNATSQTGHLISDSLDAFINCRINHPPVSTQSAGAMRTSILDAEETCHAFAIKKLSPPAVQTASATETAYSGAYGQDVSSNLFKLPCTDKVNDQVGLSQNPPSQKLSSRLFDDERSLGLTGINWNDSLGPFDLGMPAKKRIGGDSIGIGEQKLEGALLNAVVFVILIAIVTFLLVLLYYYNCTSFLRHYVRFSAFFVLASMGGSILLSLLQRFSIPLDSITCFIFLFNFTIVGVLSVFASAIPIILRQCYMVCLGIIVAAWFTKLPEWTTWSLLVALAVYDLVAVLAPGGPLKLLVDLASSRNEELPALIYEARPTVAPTGRAAALGFLVAGVTESGSGSGSSSIELQVVPTENESNRNTHGVDDSVGVVRVEDLINDEGERSPLVGNANREEERSPLVEVNRTERNMATRREEEELSERGIKLGLGDFVFYSVLVGRAAMYDLMTVYACYLAIISGLGCTLILLSVCRHALPALPISIALGVLFYFLTRLLMEPFIVGTATNLMMF